MAAYQELHSLKCLPPPWSNSPLELKFWICPYNRITPQFNGSNLTPSQYPTLKSTLQNPANKTFLCKFVTLVFESVVNAGKVNSSIDHI